MIGLVRDHILLPARAPKHVPGLRHVRSSMLNVVAASFLTPRPARYAIYRACGIDTETHRVAPGCFIGGGSLTIGRDTFVNVQCFFDTSAPITIGRSCFLGPQVSIFTSTHAAGEASKRAGPLVVEPVVIEDGCWVGARATILPGVRVGAGSVVAAGACVVDDIEPNALYGGVPARRLRALSDAL